MHCDACDALLSDKEDSRRSRTTGERIGLCNKCFSTIEDLVDATDDPMLEDMGVEPEDEGLSDDEIRHEYNEELDKDAAF